MEVSLQDVRPWWGVVNSQPEKEEQMGDFMVENSSLKYLQKTSLWMCDTLNALMGEIIALPM